MYKKINLKSSKPNAQKLFIFRGWGKEKKVKSKRKQLGGHVGV